MATRQTSATRAKDSDRDDTCRILDGALSEGQLSGAEHWQRISAATRAVTLGDLHTLVADLQTADGPVQLPALAKPARFGGRALALGAAGAAVLVGIGIGWAVYGATSSPPQFTSDPGDTSDGVGNPSRQLLSLGGLNGLLQETRAKFGDITGYRLVVYPDHALLDRPDPTESRRQLSYTYRGGWSEPTRSAIGSRTVVVDLGGFDPKAAVGILRGAPETLGIRSADVKSHYLSIEASGDPTASGALALSAYVSSDYGGGYIAFTGDGTVKRINYPS